MKTIPLALLMTAALATGCASKKPAPPMPPPPSASQAEALKASILDVNPSAKVGMVTAVLEGESMAMIADVDVAGVRKGDIFSIVDGSGTVVANGTVLEIVEGKIAVRYEAVVRAPIAGDVAAKF